MSKKAKRIVSLVICTIMLMSMCLFTGCGKQAPQQTPVQPTEQTPEQNIAADAVVSDTEHQAQEEEDDESFLDNIIPNHLSAESAFEAYMKSQENADPYAALDLVPPAYYEYKINSGKEKYGKTEEEIRESISRTTYSPISMNVDLKQFGEGYDPTVECKYTYEITDTKKANSDEVKDVNEYYKNKFGNDLKAKEVVVIKYTYSIKSKSGKLDTRATDTYGVAFKIKGDWYFHDGGIGRNFLWMTQKGLKVEDGVKWIMDFVEVSYDF